MLDRILYISISSDPCYISLDIPTTLERFPATARDLHTSSSLTRPPTAMTDSGHVDLQLLDGLDDMALLTFEQTQEAGVM